MRRCHECDYPHPTPLLPHEGTLRYYKLIADIIIAAGILLFVVVAIQKKGIVKTAQAKVPG